MSGSVLLDADRRDADERGGSHFLSMLGITCVHVLSAASAGRSYLALKRNALKRMWEERDMLPTSELPLLLMQGRQIALANASRS